MLDPTNDADVVGTDRDQARIAGSVAGDPQIVPTGSAVAGSSASRSEANGAVVSWQAAMKRAVRDPGDLLRRVGLSSCDVDTDDRPSFRTFVPLEYISRIRPGDPDDPLLRQVLPLDLENRRVEGFGSDPVGELNCTAANGLIHKYAGRVLLVTTSACGIHCRYCFRREFPYAEKASRRSEDDSAIRYIQQHQDVEEVLLSGGDPLTLADADLFRLLDRLDQIDHVKRIRFHSRMPVVIPQRVNGNLVDKLASLRSTVWMVIHCNHPSEIDDNVIEAIRRMVDRGIPVLNQAVLLKGVNDDVQTLRRLCLRLIDHRVQPYYLHQLDRVRGAAHFEVDVSVGRQLVERLSETLPGYAVPQYVAEYAGRQGKTRLG